MEGGRIMNFDNSWPGGIRHAMEQKEHEKWNESHYPGTRQICSKCSEPTDRCEEDAIWSEDGAPLCEVCSSYIEGGV